jgi:hypothetical protein
MLFLMRVGANREEAQDAAQEAMVRAHHQWRTIDQPPAWIRVVALRCYLASRARPHSDTYLWGESLNPTSVDAELAIFGEEQRYVLSLLRRLPPTQRRRTMRSCARRAGLGPAHRARRPYRRGIGMSERLRRLPRAGASVHNPGTFPGPPPGW